MNPLTQTIVHTTTLIAYVPLGALMLLMAVVIVAHERGTTPHPRHDAWSDALAELGEHQRNEIRFLPLLSFGIPLLGGTLFGTVGAIVAAVILAALFAAVAARAVRTVRAGEASA